ncbi:MAG: hypothetical protein ACMG6H_13875 [Acidobacteriota bacterium]
MRELKQVLMAVLILVMVTVGSLAQKGNSNNNRPPKETPKVVDKGKDNPPPSNRNSRGKP